MKKVVDLPEEIWVRLSRDGLRRQPEEVLIGIDKALQGARIKDQNKRHPMATKDDTETMRILFNANINELCNQGRWKDAKEMEQIRDRLIEALKAEPCISKDGTLTVNVKDGTKVSRVLVCGNNHFGGVVLSGGKSKDRVDSC